MEKPGAFPPGAPAGNATPSAGWSQAAAGLAFAAAGIPLAIISSLDDLRRLVSAFPAQTDVPLPAAFAWVDASVPASTTLDTIHLALRHAFTLALAGWVLFCWAKLASPRRISLVMEWRSVLVGAVCGAAAIGLVVARLIGADLAATAWAGAAVWAVRSQPTSRRLWQVEAAARGAACGALLFALLGPGASRLNVLLRDVFLSFTDFSMSAFVLLAAVRLLSMAALLFALGAATAALARRPTKLGRFFLPAAVAGGWAAAAAAAYFGIGVALLDYHRTLSSVTGVPPGTGGERTVLVAVDKPPGFTVGTMVLTTLAGLPADEQTAKIMRSYAAGRRTYLSAQAYAHLHECACARWDSAGMMDVLYRSILSCPTGLESVMFFDKLMACPKAARYHDYARSAANPRLFFPPTRKATIAMADREAWFGYVEEARKLYADAGRKAKLSETPADVRINRDGGTIHGRVLLNGRPEKRLTVGLMRYAEAYLFSGLYPPIRCRLVVDSAAPDEQGRFTFVHAPAGMFVLAVQATPDVLPPQAGQIRVTSSPGAFVVTGERPVADLPALAVHVQALE